MEFDDVQVFQPPVPDFSLAKIQASPAPPRCEELAAAEASQCAVTEIGRRYVCTVGEQIARYTVGVPGSATQYS